MKTSPDTSSLPAWGPRTAFLARGRDGNIGTLMRGS